MVKHAARCAFGRALWRQARPPALLLRPQQYLGTSANPSKPAPRHQTRHATDDRRPRAATHPLSRPRSVNAWAMTTLANCRTRAKLRGITSTLTLPDLIEKLLVESGLTCPIFATPRPLASTSRFRRSPAGRSTTVTPHQASRRIPRPHEPPSCRSPRRPPAADGHARKGCRSYPR